MKNRFMLAPLTNCQSHADGVLSDDEYHWLTLRAQGGFGLTMTCAAHVQAVGQGFPGQLGVWSDHHQDGLARLATKIKSEGSVSIVQLHHAGMRSPADLIGQAPVCPSEDADTGSRALSTAEVQQLVEDFVAAAQLDPLGPRAWIELARLALAQDELRDATAALVRAGKCRPVDVAFHRQDIDQLQAQLRAASPR